MQTTYPANCILIELSNTPKLEIMPKPASYKLATTFQGPNIVTHTTYLSDLATGVRLRPVQTTWTTKKTLGYGRFGSVVLQEAEGYQLRAVKKLQKGIMGIDAELKVMSKVAKVFFPPYTPPSAETSNRRYL